MRTRNCSAQNIDMALKLLILFALLQYAVSQNYSCSQRSALLLLKRPAYNFSVKILDRASQNEDGHFVFSPLTTWMQLSALAEGASGETRREIWKITNHHKNYCFKLKLARILRKLTKGSDNEFRRKSVIVIDEFMSVKKSYIKNVQKFYNIKVLLKNFLNPVTVTNEVNKFIEAGTNGVIPTAVYIDDFKDTVMLMSDNVYFRSAWKTPFNPAYTRIEDFFINTAKGVGKVNMMNQIGYFNTTELPHINARVLEIPCRNGISMLIFLPIKDIWIGDIFYDLQRTTLSSIYNTFKIQGPKLVNIRIPRFSINTSIANLPELLFDMGVRRVFDPNRSELRYVSEYDMNASFMSQIADIEVTEEGVTASATVESLVNDTASDTEDYVANEPFAFIIADRKTQFILFAGTYSKPSVY